MIAPCGARGRKSLIVDGCFMVSRASDGHYSAKKWNKEIEDV